MEHNQEYYKQKYLKYKNKYLELQKKTQLVQIPNSKIEILVRDKTRDEISNYITADMYDDKRIPSFCDRILYKGNIKVENYGTILASRLCESDHLLVFGEFMHNNLNGLLITFNIDKLDKKEENAIFLKNTFEKIIMKASQNKLDYVVVCLQESASTNIIKNIFNTIVSDLNNNSQPELLNKFKQNINWTLSYSTSSSFTNQNSKIVIIHNNLNKPIELTKLYYGSIGQLIAGSKSAIGFNFNDICFICCHLPIDTSKKTQEPNYMGNNLRIEALEKITNSLKKYPNCIISGDLNFRIYKNPNGDKVEQLDQLIKQKPIWISQYKEFGNLDVESCKLNSESSCKLVNVRK